MKAAGLRHGALVSYKTYGCRCQKCCAVNTEYQRSYRPLWQARNLADGLTQAGQPRSTPYNQNSLRLLAEHGFDPDPAWVKPPDTCRHGHVGEYNSRGQCRRCDADGRMRRHHRRKVISA